MSVQADLESLASVDSSAELNAPDGDQDSDSAPDHIDPRVQIELEKLNGATEVINKFEVQLDEARAAGRQAFTQMTHQLHQLAEKLGKCVSKARPYYESRVELKKAQTELQQAALLYEKANATLKASKEIVKLTEEGLTKQGGKLDETWQEMLNYATKKVTQCEQELRQRQREHWHSSKQYGEAESKVKALEKKFKSAIGKSKLYYELRAQMNHFVEREKFKVYRLEESIAQAKSAYSEGLTNLEGISEQIHLQRRLKDELQQQRDSGCGTISETASMNGSLDVVSIGDLQLEDLHAPSSGSSKHQKVLDALHDIIYQSKYEDDATGEVDKRLSYTEGTPGTPTRYLNDLPDDVTASTTTLRSHCQTPAGLITSRHSFHNAQSSFPLLNALETELNRLQLDDGEGNVKLSPKKPLQTVASVDSAVDSGSECEGFDPLDDEMVDNLHLDQTFSF